MRLLKKYKNGLVLSGGGVRCIAHAAIIKVLNEKNINIDAYAGTSAGAIVAAFHLLGKTPEEMLEIILSIKKSDLIKPVLPRTGFFKTQGLKDFLFSFFGETKIEDFEKPFFVCTTNLQKGKTEYLNTGSVVDALMASASLPILFQPVYINNMPYVDGGVMDNLPIDPLLPICKKLYAINVNALDTNHKISNMMHIGERSFQLAVGSNLKYKKSKADIYLEPPGLLDYGMLELKKAERIFNVGYSYATKKITSIKRAQ